MDILRDFWPIDDKSPDGLDRTARLRLLDAVLKLRTVKALESLAAAQAATAEATERQAASLDRIHVSLERIAR